MNEQIVPEPIKMVSIEEFMNIELRVGIVEEAEVVPKSKRLLKIKVNLGAQFGTKQILSGISEFFTPESLIGKRIVVVANLKPATLMGLESQGMLLAVQSDDGTKLDVIQVPDMFEPGNRVR